MEYANIQGGAEKKIRPGSGSDEGKRYLCNGAWEDTYGRGGGILMGWSGWDRGHSISQWG